jgi:hypothetical protein
MRRLILSSAALALLIAGCTAAAHLKVLQPPAAPTTSSGPAPAAGSSAAVPAYAAGKMLRGIDIDLYTYPGQDFASTAATDVAYITSLHANALSVSFPFFMNGHRAAGVHATSATPTPSQLAVLVHAARQAGLYVSIRPLLDESSIGMSRVYWAPVHPAAWFASYRKFLLPYAAMAQREHADELIVGTEFSQFAAWPRWNALDNALRSRFHGRLGCANNWGRPLRAGLPGNCGRGAQETVDAYHPQRGNLTAGWETFDRALPAGTVETEIGIAAVKGAYKAPFQHAWKTTSLDQAVQVRWFTAACHAAAKEHLGGIYFWPLGFTQAIQGGPTLADQGLWSGGLGAHAISACFAWLEKAGR